ncbi:unnamed protein product [Haemonchus placei]|uniref:Reverse transcriptase n=1 Tax=Haemonchus placei TaxID=6290 RepID=A0A0N4WNN3_HAEPC|nr:unnamed protein product [Haemonchus placei]
MAATETTRHFQIELDTSVFTDLYLHGPNTPEVITVEVRIYGRKKAYWLGRAHYDDIDIGRRRFYDDDIGRRGPFDRGFEDYRMRSIRIEYPGFPVREEDWRSSSLDRHREFINETWRRSPSPRRPTVSRHRSPSQHSQERRHTRKDHSVKERHSREKSTFSRESDPVVKGSIANLNEDELEKAARLQLQLMAEMESKDSKEDSKNMESEDKKEDSKTKGDNSAKKDGAKKEAKAVESSEKAESTKEPNGNVAAPSQQKINPPETDSHSRAVQPKESDNKLPSHDGKPSKTGHREIIVLKKKFEDIHKLPTTKPIGASWIEEYKKTVNKRKQEISSGLPVPAARPPSPVRHDIQRGIDPRVPPRLPDYRLEASSTLGNRPAMREYFQDPKTTSRDNRPAVREYFQDPKIAPRDNRPAVREYFQDLKTASRDRAIEYAREVARRSHIPLDPKQFIEELSDSEDWDEVAELVNQPPTLKRPAAVEIERPVKRGLLGTAPPRVSRLPQNGSPIGSGGSRPPGFIPPPTVAAKTLSSAHPRPSLEEKSFFRMEYPSVTPGIYHSRAAEEKEESDEPAGPPQAKIAPPKPVFHEHGNPNSWRREHAHPVPLDPMTKYGGVESKHGGYFD